MKAIEIDSELGNKFKGGIAGGPGSIQRFGEAVPGTLHGFLTKRVITLIF